MKSPKGPEYKRVMLKLSGEAIGSADAASFDAGRIAHVVREIADVRGAGISVAVVIGGGNILRGRDVTGGDRIAADAAGMFATVINGLVLANALEQQGIEAALFTAVGGGRFVREYAPADARRTFDQGAVTICAGGTGNPFFTTDTAAALRALELGADALVKGTKVDGIYSADPETDAGAQRYDRLSYKEVIARNLEVMDLTAVSLCMARKLPIVVFDAFGAGNFLRVLQGEPIGTVVRE